MKRYYSTHRPVGPGTYPRAGAHEIHNYKDRQYVKDAGCKVWGYVEYDRELTPQEVSAYDLVAGGKEADAEMLSNLLLIEKELSYLKEKRPELEDTYEYIHAACEALAKATGIEKVYNAKVMTKSVPVLSSVPAANKKGLRIRIEYVNLDENNILKSLYIDYSGFHERGGARIEVSDLYKISLPEE